MGDSTEGTAGHEGAERLSWRSQDFLLLAGILLVGIALRVVFSLHHPLDVDESVYATRAIGIVSHGSLSTIDGAPVWFYLTDAAYALLGTTNLALRLVPLLAGAGIIALLFLLCSELYGRRAGILAAALFAFSGFAIANNVQMDLVMTFFVLLSLCCFIQAFRSRRHSFAFFAAAILFNCIAVLVKATAFFVFPVYLIVLLLSRKRPQFLEERAGLRIGIAAAICALCAFPLLAYNYLIHKHVGILDLPLTSALGKLAGSPYAGLSVPSVSLPHVFENLRVLLQIARIDPILIALLVVGLALFARKMRYGWLIASVFGAQLLFVLSSTPLGKHYVVLLPLGAIVGGYAASELIAALERKAPQAKAHAATLAFVVLLCAAQLLIYHPYLEQDNQAALKSYVEENVPEGSLLIVDERFYTPTAFWIGNDKDMVMLFSFARLYGQLADSPDLVEEEIHYVRCASGDCGWGAGKISPQMEELDAALMSQASKSGRLLARIDDGPGHRYEVYAFTMSYPRDVKRLAPLTNSFYFYSLRWKNLDQTIDAYDAQGADAAVHSAAYAVLLLLTLVAALGLVVPYVALAYAVKE